MRRRVWRRVGECENENEEESGAERGRVRVLGRARVVLVGGEGGCG